MSNVVTCSTDLLCLLSHPALLKVRQFISGEFVLSWLVFMQRDPGIAVRAGRGLRMYHYQRMGLPPPEHGKGHFHNPGKNYKASRAVKKQLKAGPEQGGSFSFIAACFLKYSSFWIWED